MAKLYFVLFLGGQAHQSSTKYPAHKKLVSFNRKPKQQHVDKLWMAKRLIAEIRLIFITCFYHIDPWLIFLRGHS